MRDTILRHAARSLIREASRNDGNLFITLWQEYLDEQYKSGGEIMPTSASMRVFYQLFRNYVDHRSMQGVVLFGPNDESVSMYGAAPEAIETRFGSTATAWGDYVRPQYRKEGWASELRKVQVEKLRAMGFETIMGAVYAGNDAGEKSAISFGFGPEPISRSYIYSLKE